MDVITGISRRHLKVGVTLHLKIVDIAETALEKALGIIHLEVEDVTPLPGAEPTSYTCKICGAVKEGLPDGHLPEGWREKKYAAVSVPPLRMVKGSCVVCCNAYCLAEPICRICGCTRFNACVTPEGPCHWVETDLCSACGK